MNYEDYRTLRFERVGHVLRVVIDNPASATNAVDTQLHAELARFFAQLRHEREARAVLLTGSKEAFCAGGDPEFVLGMRDTAVLATTAQQARQMICDLVDVEIPVVAALNGDAYALGASIALLCDAVFMAESATLCDPHVVIGIAAGDGGVIAWPLAMGPMLAKRYLLTGDPLTARDAERLGLVSHVLPADELDAAAMAFAERLAARAPLAVRFTKMGVNKILKNVLNGASDSTLAHELMTFLTADMVEAMTALQEGRDPHFEGR